MTDELEQKLRLLEASITLFRSRPQKNEIKEIYFTT